MRSLLAVALFALVPAAPAAATGPCAGVDRCHVVAHVDVDGDGTPETVAVARTGKDGGPHGTVTLRVQRGSTVLSATRPLEYWYGAAWHGAADVDGRPGQELFFGRTQGAHAQLFAALTLRGGRLVTLRAPGRGYQGLWIIDQSVMYESGWLRRASDAPGVVRFRHAERHVSPDDGRFTGVVKTFRWTRDGWARTAYRRDPELSAATAETWGGFRVAGLPRF
jgi:hypothetical protein